MRPPSPNCEKAETEAGRDAWQDYFRGTADGLREQSALWGEAMRGIIAEVIGGGRPGGRVLQGADAAERRRAGRIRPA